MSNEVNFTVKLNDLASGVLGKIGIAGNSAFGKLSGGLMGVQKQIGQASYQLALLNKPVSISVNTSGLQAASAQIDTLQSKILMLGSGAGGGWSGGGGSGGNAYNRFGRGGSGGGGGNNPGDEPADKPRSRFGWFGMGGFARQALAIAGIGGAAYLGKDIMQSGIERQMNLTSFEVLLGKKPGNTLNSGLLKFAKDSIYGNEVFNEGKLLAGSGVKAQNIMPVMKMIGDIAMGDKERMKSLALAFSETNTRGNLSGITERMFLQGGLFNPLEQLHKMTGKSLPVLKKEMEKGKISVNELAKAMEFATGPAGRWHDMMKKLQDTPAGKWTAFTGTVRTLAGTIGLNLLPALGGITTFLQALVDNTPLLYGIAGAIGSMTVAWMAYTVWVERAAIWQGILEVAAYWPLAVVGIVGGALATLGAKNDDYAASTENTAGRIFNAFAIIRHTYEDITYWMDSLNLKVVSYYEKLARFNTLQSSGHPIDAVKSIFQDTNSDKKLHQLQIDHVWNRAMDLAGLDGNGKKKAAAGLDDIFKGAFTPDKAGKDDVLGDTTKGITGGGVRNITINVAKFQDKTEIHAATFKEGVADIEEILKDMFLRITNSAASAMN